MNFQIETLTESALREHYVEQGLPDRAIGLLYGRSSVWVCKQRARYRITLPQGGRNYPTETLQRLEWEAAGTATPSLLSVRVRKIGLRFG